MKPRTYRLVSAAVFTAVAAAHAVRLLFGWRVVIGGWDAPLWLSWAALSVAAVLAWLGFQSEED